MGVEVTARLGMDEAYNLAVTDEARLGRLVIIGFVAVWGGVIAGRAIA